MQETQTATNPAMLLPLLVADTLKDMRRHKEAREWWAYWVGFEFAMKYMAPHIKGTIRRQLQRDSLTLVKLIELIKVEQTNETTKAQMIDEARTEFASAREFHIFNALPNIGLGADLIDAEINWDKLDIKKVAEAVQGKSSGIDDLDKSYEAGEEPEEVGDP